MKHNYHERKQRRIDYAKQQAAKCEQESTRRYDAAREISSFIPPGQPILVGHYSEKRHRRDLAKIDNYMRKSIEATDKATYYRDKAEIVENNNAISSDNPDALALLKEKLERLTAMQEFMKQTNKFIKKNDKDAFLKLPSATEALWTELTSAASRWDIGYPHYRLSNNNAVIRNTKQRIAKLEKLTALTTQEFTFKGVRVVQNVEANRIQLIFPGKPVEKVREALRHNGFTFCREEMAWQRQLNNAGFSAAKFFLRVYTPE
ncbi:DUF3560 domain-containing protein [Chitinophaga sp. Ak27]|uniref:DUF3560 domain-containing protein n=1 Tax=Chitinophaga sp. Ak27 TaxID=2726116 RepID=UPI00145C9453|nr:DUF3560 domain-containing protein [Chitinophaga sp. Ak27]NLU91364.1 DUF3560 domain-containing protein [Chitinophaga sp. Ak27]